MSDGPLSLKLCQPLMLQRLDENPPLIEDGKTVVSPELHHSYYGDPGAMLISVSMGGPLSCDAETAITMTFDDPMRTVRLRTLSWAVNGGRDMFVNIVNFPKIKDGKDTEFRQWFTESNRAYASHPGFIRRVLLQPREAGGHYAALVEHESYETFMAMHTSDTQAGLRKRVELLLDGNPDPVFYTSLSE